jgi:O-6-methylguanine DNA methyltransferase
MMEGIRVLQETTAPEGFVAGVLRRCGLIDGYACVRSPIGIVYAAAGKRGITAVQSARSDAEFERRYLERFGRRVERRDELVADLQCAVEGGVDAAVDLEGCNAFQRDVLEATRRIPAGTVRPYAWIAREIGRPRAVRAVGTALARNPVPLVVPCHRVVRSDGATGSYALGVGAPDKVTLLRHEGVDVDEVRRRMPLQRFWSEEGDSTFCYPYCFAARPLTDRRIVEFASARDAVRRGLAPCSTCHPSLAA